MRVTLRFTFNGETKTLREWSQCTGIGLIALKQRAHAKWPVERMLTTPQLTRPNKSATETDAR